MAASWQTNMFILFWEATDESTRYLGIALRVGNIRTMYKPLLLIPSKLGIECNHRTNGRNWVKPFSEGFIGDTLLKALLHSNVQRQLVLGAYQFLSIFDSAVAHGPQWSDICFSMVVISTWTEEGQVLSIQHGRTTPAKTAGNSCATLNEKISSLKVGAILLGAKMGFEFKVVMVLETFCQYPTVQTVTRVGQINVFP